MSWYTGIPTGLLYFDRVCSIPFSKGPQDLCKSWGPFSYLFSMLCLCSSPHVHIWSKIGISDLPRSVRLYSTFGGIWGYSSRCTMPVYWYSIPAQIKSVIDRIFCLVVGGKDIAGKECALITCCEEDDLSVMDGVRIPMERMCALNKWKMVGEVLVPGVLNVGDIDKTDGCAKAAALADVI